jgi:hypothetical protein
MINGSLDTEVNADTLTAHAECTVCVLLCVLYFLYTTDEQQDAASAVLPLCICSVGVC